MAGDLEGKVVVITGGGDGIGRECALAYAREKATVAILDYNLDAAQRTATEMTTPGVALRADVSDGEAVRSAISEVLTRFRRIDAVHNNAGVSSPSKPPHQTTEDEWDHLFNVNLKSVLWTTRAALAALKESRGSILNTASMVGLIGQANHAELHFYLIAPDRIRRNQGRHDFIDQSDGVRLRATFHSRERNLSRRRVDPNARTLVRRTTRSE